MKALQIFAGKVNNIKRQFIMYNGHVKKSLDTNKYINSSDFKN